MKKALFISLIILGLLLGGCRTKPTIDAHFVSELFAELDLDTNHIFINRVNTSSSHPIDRVEIINRSDSQAIIIKVIDTVLNEDYAILITPSFIYDTRTMTKRVNPYPNTEVGREAAIEANTTLLDFSIIELDYYLDLAQNLTKKTYDTSRLYNTLRGQKRESSSQQYYEYVEFKIMDDCLLEVHFRLEEDFQSTKKESNYISGIHFYFSDQMPLDFPPLNEFFED